MARESLRAALCRLSDTQWEEFLFYIEDIYPAHQQPSKKLPRYEQVDLVLSELSTYRSQLCQTAQDLFPFWEHLV